VFRPQCLQWVGKTEAAVPRLAIDAEPVAVSGTDPRRARAEKIFAEARKKR